MRLLIQLVCLMILLSFIPTIQAAQIRGLGDKCLDAAGESSENGTHLILWECTGRENQNWYFNEKGELRGINNKCVDAASRKNGTQLILWDCNGKDNQQWHLSTDGQIQGMSNKCFDMTGNVSDNGTKITLWKCHGKRNQLWRIVSNDNNNMGSQQREKKRWYHEPENNVNRPNQRQSSVIEDSRDERRQYDYSAYPNQRTERSRTEQSAGNRWNTSNPKNEALCRNLYDIHNKCYAVGVMGASCDRAINNSQQEMAQSTDPVNYHLYSDVAAAVCADACRNGINANGAPSYEEFSNTCL